VGRFHSCEVTLICVDFPMWVEFTHVHAIYPYGNDLKCIKSAHMEVTAYA